MRTDISNFVRTTAAIERRHAFAVEAYGKAAGNKMVAYAKRNHPWANRTHNAQNTITATTGWTGGNRLRVNLHSGVNYGVYLEYKTFKHKGRLSIWWPTVQRHKLEILRGWARAVSK